MHIFRRRKGVIIKNKVNEIIIFVCLIITLFLYLYPFYGMLATIVTLRLMQKLKRCYKFYNGDLIVKNFLFKKIIYNYADVELCINGNNYVLKSRNYGYKILKFRSLKELESVNDEFIQKVQLYSLLMIWLCHRKWLMESSYQIV